MRRNERGFTLVELITVIILISIISVTLFSRMNSVSTTTLQAGRDDLIAALFFAQQTAMARDNNIQLVLTTNSVSVTENGVAIVVHSQGYPLRFPSGVTTTAFTFSYDKLGRTTARNIVLSATDGKTATVAVEASGYAH